MANVNDGIGFEHLRQSTTGEEHPLSTHGQRRARGLRAAHASVLAVAVSLSAGPVARTALANPVEPSVQAGSVAFEESGPRLDVRQSTDKAIIDWRGFSIAGDEITQFHQPSSSSITLNRVTGSDPSNIFGTLQANGQIVLVNPNGVFFGPGSRIDVAGLVATTTDIRDEDFLGGIYDFSIPSRDPNATVVNEGQITIAEAGYAALVAPAVRNSGTINARLGRVTLGAAQTFAIDLYGDNLVVFQIGTQETSIDTNGEPIEALVDNSGAIFADGGTVTLQASNVGAVVRSVVNMGGVIQANSFENKNGRVVLGVTGQGTTRLAGRIEAEGGTVEIAGTDVIIEGGAEIAAARGTVRITADVDVNLRDASILAELVFIAADADLSGAHDPETHGGDALLENVTIDVEYLADSRGGWVEITGDRVALLGATEIDTSGAYGGGEVRIGGDFQGSGDIRTADATVVADTVVINADAGNYGDGGRVIVWADDVTKFYGNITATGGVNGGNGGFAEVSGKQYLDYQGITDLTAALGEVGTLLLDPNNITIQVGGSDTNIASNPNFTTTDDTAILLTGTIETALATSAVTITTASAGTNSEVGNITVSDSITAPATANSLTLNAVKNIIINAAIDMSAGTGTLTLNADTNDSSTGNLNFASAAGDLTTNGTDITLTGANWISVAGVVINSNGGDITVTPSILTEPILFQANSGDFDMTDAEVDVFNAGTGDLIFGGAGFSGLIKTQSIDITIGSTANNIILETTGNVNIATGNFFDSGTNDLIIRAANLAVSAAIAANGQTVTIEPQGTDAIDLGTNSGAGNTLELTDAELDLITATTLIIGSATAGAIVISADISPALTTALHLINNSTITGTAGGITETSLALTTTGGTINFTDATTEITTLAISAAGQTVTFTDNTATTIGTVDGVVGVTAGAFTLNTDDRIAVTQAITTDTGNLVLDGDANATADTNDDITFTAGLIITSAGSMTLDARAGTTMTGAGALTLNADNGVTLNASLTTAGTTVIDADNDNSGAGDFTVAAATALSAGNNAITITADDMVLTGTVSSGTAKTTLLTSTGIVIDLGTATGGQNLSATEINNITAGSLQIGDGTAGAIVINADITPTGTTILRLHSGSTVTATAGGIIETSLAIVAGGAVNFTDISTSVANLAIDTSTGNITFTEADGFTVTTVDSIVGVDTDSGTLALTATTGDITVVNTANADDIQASGNITLSTLADEASVTVSASADVESTAGNITIASDKIVLTGTVTASAGASQSVTLTANDNDAIDLGTDGSTADTFEVTNTTIDQITTDTIVIGSGTAGAITVSADINPANATGLHLASGGAVTGTAGGIIETSLAIEAGGAVNFTDTSTAVTNLAISAGGNVVFIESNGFTVDTVAGVTGVATSAGSVTLTATTGNLTVANTAAANDISATTTITLEASADNALIDIQASADVESTGGAHSYTADELTLAGTITATGQSVTIKSKTAGDTIELGLDGGTADQLELSNAELQKIAAGSLIVGSGTAGAVTVTADITPGSSAGADVTTLHIITGSTVDADAGSGGGIIETDLAITAGGAVDISDASTSVTNLAISAGGNVVFTESNGFTVDTVAGVTGVATSAGSVTLTATTGNLTVANTAAANDISATTTITLEASADNALIDIQASADVESTGGAHSYTADELTLAGTITATGQSVTIKSKTAGDTIELGLDGGTADQLELSNAELQKIAAGSLIVGSSAAGAVTVTADITPGSSAGADVTTLHIITGSTVTGTAGGIIETNLAIAAGGTINFTDLSTAITTLAVSDSGQTVTFTDLGGLDIGAVDGVTGVTATTFNLTTAGAITDSEASTISGTATFDAGATTNNITFDSANDFSTVVITQGQNVTLVDTNALILGASAVSGTLTATAQGGVTVNAGVTTGGVTTIDADSDDNGVGDFAVTDGITLSSGGNTLTITANDINLNTSGALNSGAAATTLLVSDGGTIGLGATAGDYTLSGAELQNITANGLTIGNNTNGNITVNGITAANSNNIAGTLTLNATVNDGDVTFATAASTFNALTVNADDTIFVNVNITTDEGNLVLQADVDAAVDTQGDKISIAAGVTLTTAAGLTLTASTGGVDAAGALTLSAANGLTLGDMTIAGITALNADNDDNGTGTYTQSAGTIFSSSNNALTITANDIDLQGSITSGTAATTLLVSNGGVITLGGAGVNLNLSTAEIDKITAGKLIIGDATAGAITVAADITPTGTTTLHLITGSTVTGTAGGIIETNLAITAGDTVNITDASSDVDVLAVSAAGESVTFTDLDGIDIGTVDGVVGVVATTFNLNTTGAITDSQALTVTGTTTIAAGGANDITLNTATNNFSTLAITSGNNVTLVDTNGLILGASTVSGTLNVTTAGALTDSGALAVTGTTTLAAGAGNDITLNTAGNDFSTLAITSGNNVTLVDTNALVLGASTVSGTLNVTAAGALTDSGALAVTGTTTLAAGGANDITLNTAGNDFSTVAITSGNNVTLVDTNALILGASTVSGTLNVTTAGALTDSGALAVTGTTTLAAGGANDITLDTAGNDFSTVAITSGNNVTLVDTNALTLNGATIQGALSATTASGLTIAGNFTTNNTNAGANTIDADSDDNGTGDFTVAAAVTLNTGGSSLSITANDLILTGSLNSGAAATTLLVSDGGTIGLGATAGNYTIDGAELGRITATGLTIGDATNGNITVNGITAANSNNITGTVTLNATADNASIAFATAVSTFNALTANADDGITLTFAPTTDMGALDLDGDADNAADVNDDITFTAGMTLFSAGSLTLDGTSGGLVGAGALTLNANGDVTLSATLTAAGNIDLTADFDTNGAGNFSATGLDAGVNTITIGGITVDTGSSLLAGTATIDGAITGNGVNVTTLTLTGVSADMNGTVNGISGTAAAAEVNMPDAATHKFNGCTKSGCAASVSESSEISVGDLDVIFQVTIVEDDQSAIDEEFTLVTASPSESSTSQDSTQPSATPDRAPGQDEEETDCPDGAAGSEQSTAGGCSDGSGGDGA